MEPQDKQTLKNNAFSFLQHQTMAVIATVSPQGHPEAATVMYIMDEEWNLYVLTHKDSRKVANITSNSSVALVIGTSAVAQTIQIQATASLINTGDPQYPAISQKIAQSQLATKDPIFGAYKDNYIIVKIHIDWMRLLTFDQMTNKENYTVLIP